METRDIALTDRVMGCLLAGAVGDALGEPIEFLSLAAIRRQYGDAGVQGYVSASARFTDDTQMTLFTVEGLVLALEQSREGGNWDPVGNTRAAYLRWLQTQSLSAEVEPQGWLLDEPGLHRRMAPGNTCISALMDGGRGTTLDRINDSKGCGGVMRTAPAAFVGGADVFELANDLAAITHGHPSGFYSSGALTVIMKSLVSGESIESSLSQALNRLRAVAEAEEVTRCLERAIDSASSGSPSAEKVEAQGEGWVAEEALGISVYCALVAQDFVEGVLLAVNHGGDSDSTGSIAGQIIGTMGGEAVIPVEWLDALDLRQVVEETADRFIEALG